MVFQSFNLLPRMTLEENVELPLRLAEVDRGERHLALAKPLSALGLPHEGSTARANSPVASSSAARWRAHL